MQISIAPELQAFLREKLDAGRYQNANEAINDALRLLKERDEKAFDGLRHLLQAREKQSKRNQSVPFDEKVREGIRRRGMKRLNATKGSGN